MQQNVENRIRERAYQLWEAGGYQDGAADQHWLAAEREVLAASIAATTAADPLATAKSAKKPARSRRRAA